MKLPKQPLLRIAGSFDQPIARRRNCPAKPEPGTGQDNPDANGGRETELNKLTGPKKCHRIFRKAGPDSGTTSAAAVLANVPTVAVLLPDRV